MGLKTAVSIARNVSIEENALTYLHLDHCNDIVLVKSCLDEGFDSIMIDASDKNIDDNILITRQVVKLAESYKVNVEAELGYVPKPNNEIENDKFTEPADVKRFTEETGITSLAIAIGSKHGFYKGEPKLDIVRLKEIRKITNAYLVLHGASGIPADILREAISLSLIHISEPTRPY